MKVKTIILSAVLAITVVGAFNVHVNSNNTKASISLANIEALASMGEGDDFLCYYLYSHYCQYGDVYILNVEDTRY